MDELFHLSSLNALAQNLRRRLRSEARVVPVERSMCNACVGDGELRAGGGDQSTIVKFTVLRTRRSWNA
jgi:hypothetical protein